MSPSPPPPPAVIAAIFSQADVQFSETITLSADGSYRQEETQKKTALYGSKSLCHPFPMQRIDPLNIIGSKRTSTWHVLAKDGGLPVPFKTLADLPKDTVIVLTDAMPFGITWERQLPSECRGTRTLPAAAFQTPTTAKNNRHWKCRSATKES